MYILLILFIGYIIFDCYAEYRRQVIIGEILSNRYFDNNHNGQEYYD